MASSSAGEQLTEARAEVARLQGVIRVERNHWQALLRHYPDDETVEVSIESARSTEKRLSAALEPPRD